MIESAIEQDKERFDAKVLIITCGPIEVAIYLQIYTGDVHIYAVDTADGGPIESPKVVSHCAVFDFSG